jgi:putative copper export protein
MHEPLIEWPQPFVELLGFLAMFLRAGAVGLCLTALRGGGAGSPAESEALAWAGRRAAWLGFAGAVVAALLFAQGLPEVAARRHVAIGALVTHDPVIALNTLLFVLAALGLLLVGTGVRGGWWVAGAAVLAQPFLPAFFGRWRPVVNPLHELAAGLWIGTLFLLVVVGLAAVSRRSLPQSRRGPLAREMVDRFSPLALISAGVLATMGVTTAWLHLKRLDALWSTPYGITLVVKLCLVATVIGFGAWNWLRQKRQMGDERGAAALVASARRELTVAILVLTVTAVLVSLPTPGEHEDRAAPAPTPAGPGAPTPSRAP